MAYNTLQEYLDSLVEQRAAITIQIAGVRVALGLPAEDGAAIVAPAIPGAGTPAARRDGPPGHIRPDAFFRMSIPEAIKAFLEIMKQPQNPKSIVDGLKAGGVLSEAEHFDANVRTAIKRLSKQGQVVNTKRGAWGLADWYSGRSGAGLAERPKKKGKGKGKRKATKTGEGGPAPAKPKRSKSEYQAFVAEQRKGGKTLAEIGPLWRQRKGGG